MKSLKKGQIFTEIIVCLLIAALLLTACDVDMQVYKCRVVKEPTRTEYPVGYNGDIDMNGVEIIGIHRNGTDYDLGKIDFQPYSRYSLNTPKTVYWDDSEVDYSMPGEYYIYIYYLNKNKADDSFPITIVCQRDGSADSCQGDG